MSSINPLKLAIELILKLYIYDITYMLIFECAKILRRKRSIKIFKVFGLATTDNTYQMSVIDESTSTIHMPIHTSTKWSSKVKETSHQGSGPSHHYD